MRSPLTRDEALVRCEEVLQHLEQVSFVAQRDARAALPALESVDVPTRLVWLEAARDLFFHDREAGKAFMRRTPELVALWPDVRAWTAQALAFRQWVNSWYALDGFLTQAGRVYADWGEDGESGWYHIGLHWCARRIEDGRTYFEADYQRLADGEGLAGIEAVMAPAESLFEVRQLMLETYLPGALVARNVVGTQGLEPWARRGADLMQSGRSRGEAYFQLANEEGVRYLLDELPGYRLRQHGPFLQLLLIAWFDEDIPLADSDWRPGKGLPMVLCDGRSLLMPAVMEDRETAIVALLHAGGHLRFDTYAEAEISALFDSRGLAHPPLDPDLRMTWRPLFAEFEARMFRFQALFDLCEDVRVDSRLGALVPGYRSRLARLLESAATPDGPAAVFHRFACTQLKALCRDEPLDPRLAPLVRDGAGLKEAYAVALTLFEDPAFPELTAEARDLAYPPAHGVNTGPAVYPRPRYEVLHDSPHVDAYAGHQQTREKQREEQPQQAPGQRQSDPDADINQPMENTSGSGGRIGAGIPMPAKNIRGRGVTREVPAGGLPYPEWDYREQRYLPDWARLHESVLEDSAPERAAQILAEHAGVLKRLRAVLERQRPHRPAPLRRQPEGDDLDMEATVTYVTEKRAGLSPEGRIYRRRAAQHRDTAVMLLADLSTSIMANHPDGQGKVVDRIRAGLILFSEAINSLGDPYAISGFASNQHDHVYYYLIKDFAEAADAQLNGRLAALSGRLASRMGTAIRHSVKRFAGVGAHHRLLLLLTDGRPADYDDGGDPRYLNEDTRRAMKEAHDAGIHPFCITLDPAGGEYLPAIFGPGHFTLVDHIDELPSRLPEIYLRLRR